MSDTKTMRVLLKDVRIAYAHGLWEAKQPEQGGEAKFGCAFLFPEDHEAVKLIDAACKKVAQARWGTKAETVLSQLKAADRLPVHDGALKTGSAGYAGNLYVNANNKAMPRILDRDRTVLTQADGKPYSGCYVNALIDVWTQDNKFGKRINAGLAGVQFLRDGERLAGGSIASIDEFEEIDTQDPEDLLR